MTKKDKKIQLTNNINIKIDSETLKKKKKKRKRKYKKKNKNVVQSDGTIRQDYPIGMFSNPNANQPIFINQQPPRDYELMAKNYLAIKDNEETLPEIKPVLAIEDKKTPKKFKPITNKSYKKKNIDVNSKNDLMKLSKKDLIDAVVFAGIEKSNIPDFKMKDKEKYIDEFLSVINPKKKVSLQKKPIPEPIPEPTPAPIKKPRGRPKKIITIPNPPATAPPTIPDIYPMFEAPDILAEPIIPPTPQTPVTKIIKVKKSNSNSKKETPPPPPAPTPAPAPIYSFLEQPQQAPINRLGSPKRIIKDASTPSTPESNLYNFFESPNTSSTPTIDSFFEPPDIK